MSTKQRCNCGMSSCNKNKEMRASHRNLESGTNAASMFAFACSVSLQCPSDEPRTLVVYKKGFPISFYQTFASRQHIQSHKEISILGTSIKKRLSKTKSAHRGTSRIEKGS
jgi:hypothetical protein